MPDVKPSELALASDLRVRTFPQRMVAVATAALVLHVALGWTMVWLWAGAYGAACLFEQMIGRGYRRREAENPMASAWAYVASISLVSLAYGSITVPLMLFEHDNDGEVFGGIVLAGGLVNSLIVSRGSWRAFMATVGPFGGYLLFNPVLGMIVGVDELSWITILGVLMLLLHTNVAWSQYRGALASEAAARDEAERRRKDAEFANDAKSAFVATVSHELRTPLSGVIAVGAELQRKPRDAAETEAVEVLVDAGRFMKTLLDDLLDLAKLEAGRMTVEAVSFDPGDLLWKLERHWTATARDAGKPLQLTAAINLPAYVEGDPTRLRQILNNLLSNALKFTGPEGVTWSVSGQEDGDLWWLELRVSDSGPGIPKDKLARLFTPYDQTDDSIARTHGGTGLGLALSRELARAMGGELSVESEPGCGSTFVLNVPMRRATSAAVQVAASAQTADADFDIPPPPMAAPRVLTQSAPAGAVRVLVVDDHPINRRTAALLLEAVGMEVSAVESGEEALAVLQAEPFDVVLSDLHMPGMNGLALARAIRERTGLNRSIPVVALSGADSAEDQAACRAAGMRACVSKPIDPKALYRAIEEACSGRLPAAERLRLG